MAFPSFVNLTPEPFAYVTRECTMSDIAKTVEDCFCTLNAALNQAKVAPAGPPVARYSHVANGKVTIDLGFPVNDKAIGSLRAAGLSTGLTGGGEAMRAMHEGSYETLQHTYEAVLGAIAAAGRAPSDEMWERYLTGRETPAESARTEVLWPLKPAPASYE